MGAPRKKQYGPVDTRLDPAQRERAERIAAAVEPRPALKPVVSALPSAAELHGVIADVVGLEVLAALGQQWARAMKLLYDFMAARVTVAPPADQSTREALATLIQNELTGRTEYADHCADAILAAFPNLRLRRIPTQQEWEKTFQSNLHMDEMGPLGVCAHCARAVVEELSALAEPVELNQDELAPRFVTISPGGIKDLRALRSPTSANGLT